VHPLQPLAGVEFGGGLQQLSGEPLAPVLTDTQGTGS
jgi:hypothetical protein